MTLITPTGPRQTARLSIAEVLERIRVARFSPEGWRRRDASRQLIDDAERLCAATISVAEIRDQARQMAVLLGTIVEQSHGRLELEVATVNAFDPMVVVAWEVVDDKVVLTLEESDGVLDGPAGGEGATGDGGQGDGSSAAGPVDREGAGTVPVPVMRPSEGAVSDSGADAGGPVTDPGEVRGVSRDPEVTT